MWQPGPCPQGRSFVASLRDGLRPPLTARPRLPFHTRRAARGRGIRSGDRRFLGAVGGCRV
ncbi:hypothetical protein EAO71_34660 [Streptomyces sp. ms191]|nr:hypothetical protein EAO71_34660 [Streptomyces sp. ms191]